MAFSYCTFSSVVYSLGNAYYWVKKDHVQVPVKTASQYASENSAPNEIVVVLFTENFFNVDAVKFFLLTSEQGERELWDYPEKRPVDVYKPVFNETWLIEQCKTLDVKFLLLHEYGNMNYFLSDWKSIDVLDKMLILGASFWREHLGRIPTRYLLYDICQLLSIHEGDTKNEPNSSYR